MAPTVYRSSYPDIDLLDIDLVSYLFSNPSNMPDDTALFVDAITGDARTFGAVKQRTKSLAHGLRALGVKQRDVVAFFSPNTVDYAVTCYAIIGCGATVSPVNAASTVLELEAQLQTSGAEFLIAHSSLFAIAQKAAKSTAVTVQKLIQADGATSPNSTATAEHLATTSPASDLISIPSAESDTRLAFMCFSSGTTGRAKGVMTSHRNMVSNMLQWQAHLAADFSRQTHVAFLPFSHIYGLNTYMCSAICSGSTVVVMPRFDLDLYLSRIAQYRPVQLVLVPPVVLLLVKHPLVAKHDLSSVRRILSAAAPLSVELREAVEQRFKQLFNTDVYCFQAWGMTETSPLATAVPSDKVHKRNSVGNITPNMEFRVVDPETMQDCALDATGTCTLPGEIWCRGPNVMKGYYRNDEATRSGFATDELGREWFRTGDIGTMDTDGFMAIVDRIKELIKYKGLQVTPAELEGKLLEHPDVEDACVVGIWVDEQATELPVGFVVVNDKARQRAGGEAEVKRGIHAWLNDKVANHKRLRGGLHIVDAIPKSTSGKILRRQLKESLKTPKAAKL